MYYRKMNRCIAPLIFIAKMGYQLDKLKEDSHPARVQSRLVKGGNLSGYQ